MKTNLPPWSSSQASARHGAARLWKTLFLLSTAVAMLALALLLASITNQAFGITAVENKVDPQSLAAKPLEQLSNEELIQILRDALTSIGAHDQGIAGRALRSLAI